MQEYHLQAAINAHRSQATGGQVADTHIPTPDVTVSQIDHAKLYPAKYAQPKTYIRFSSTVEDCVGVLYCMSSEDEAFLKELNSKRLVTAPGQPAACTEDWFEEIMSSFEDTSTVKQPFAAVDNTPVLSLEELVEAFDESVEDPARLFASYIYPYWKDERIKNGNRPLMPKLKTLRLDGGQEVDDSDAYICFRRREARQVRKTRGRDAQLVDKLKKLRRELEESRNIVHHVKQRETGRKEDLALSRKLFEQRAEVRLIKQDLKIKDDEDDLLIDQKAPKRRPGEQPVPQAKPGTVRLSARPDPSQGVDNELVPLALLQNRREGEITKHINESILAHERWNKNFIDDTKAALVDPSLGLWSSSLYDDEDFENGFVGMKVDNLFQLTPPESPVADEVSDSGESEPMDVMAFQQNLPSRLARPNEYQSFDHQPRYKTRRGRGGRMVVDRHNMNAFSHEDINPVVADRFKYDRESGDEEDVPMIDLDSGDSYLMRMAWQNRESSFNAQAATRRTSASSRDVPMTNGV